MGFMSFSLNYYCGELQKLESGAATAEKIYRAKQLLKMLDDLVDEGYTELCEELEKVFQGVSRLRKYLQSNHAEPFELQRKTMNDVDVMYEQEKLELVEAIDIAIRKTGEIKTKSDDAFLNELTSFCKWIGHEENTAYIFLLRDTLLPYIYYKSRNRKGIYPWLLGRKTLELLVGKSGVDDVIRASLMDALEYGECSDFKALSDIVLPDISKKLCEYPQMKSCLMELLAEIREERVIVVESGCSGTFPLLLMSLDKRVDMRMYTTYPYLLKVYGNKIFTPKYEENRLFETMYSQDLYFQFSDLQDGHFYVNKCTDLEVEKRALAEIKAMLE